MFYIADAIQKLNKFQELKDTMCCAFEKYPNRSVFAIVAVMVT